MLHLALRLDYLPLRELLHARGVKIEGIRLEEKQMPLLLALQSMKVERIRGLLKLGANINATDRSGRSPLQKYAFILGSSFEYLSGWEVPYPFNSVLELLLDYGADPNAADTTFAWVPLQWAFVKMVLRRPYLTPVFKVYLLRQDQNDLFSNPARSENGFNSIRKEHWSALKLLATHTADAKEKALKVLNSDLDRTVKDHPMLEEC